MRPSPNFAGRLWRCGPPGLARWAAALVALFLLLLAAPARADKVLVLPFQSAGAATSTDLSAAQAATTTATTQLAHKLPTASEIVTAQVAVKDGVADTSEEYRAAGRASSSDWTVSGRVEAHGASYHLEIEACQVSSGPSSFPASYALRNWPSW